jgi:hypothetical protein
MPNALNAAQIAVGTISGGATTIYADVSGQPTAAGDPPLAARWVTLSTNYAMLDPPGFPARPSFTGADAADLQYPRTPASGLRFQSLACEAAALVAAGAASYS